MTNATKKILMPKYSVVCRENDKESDLYYIKSGTLLICTRDGSRVTPLAYVTAGEYFGEVNDVMKGVFFSSPTLSQ